MLAFYQVILRSLGILIFYHLYQQIATSVSRHKATFRLKCGPIKRLPDWDPVFGLQAFLDVSKWFQEHKILEKVRWRFESLGTHTFRQKQVGQPVISTIEPQNLKTILSLDFDKWSLGRRRKDALSLLLGPGIFCTDGTHWAHSRAMLRPSFVRSQVADLAMLEIHVRHLIDSIPRDGSTVDLQDLCHRFTLDAATEFLFGESTGCLVSNTKAAKVNRLSQALARGQDDVVMVSRTGKLGWLLLPRTFKEDKKYVHDLVDEFVRKALDRHRSGTTDATKYIIADALVAQMSDKARIRTELVNILVAGRDTVAGLLSNVFHALSRSSCIQAKLYAEIEEIVGWTNTPHYEQLKEMRYLRAVLNESLRLYPIVPLNSREALVDTTLPMGGGLEGNQPIFVAKGTVVIWSTDALHRRKDLYGEDAEEFRPERWLDSGDGKPGLRVAWEYLPFNGGPRACLGQQLALVEVSYVTVRLLQEFKAIESRDSRPWTERITLNCVNLNGCPVSLTVR